MIKKFNKSLLILSNLIIGTNVFALNMSNEFVEKNKKINSIIVKKYKYDNQSHEVTEEIGKPVFVKTFNDFINAKAVIRDNLRTGDYYKVVVEYYYKDDRMADININHIDKFRSINTDLFINNNDKKTNNDINVNFYQSKTQSGTVIGNLSQVYGAGNIMRVYTEYDPKNNKISFIGEKIIGQVFYGDIIKKICQRNEPLPKFIYPLPSVGKGYVLSLYTANGPQYDPNNFNGQSVNQFKAAYQKYAPMISLEDNGISNNECTNILNGETNVYELIDNMKIFNSDGTFNANNTTYTLNYTTFKSIIADVMYDSGADEGFAKYDNYWDTKNGSYCIRHIRFVGCVKTRSWQGFSTGVQLDKIVSKRYMNKNIVITDDVTKNVHSLYGMFKQNEYAIGSQIIENSISSNFVVFQNQAAQYGMESIKEHAQPNAYGVNTDVYRYKDKSMGFWTMVLKIIVITLNAPSILQSQVMSSFFGMDIGLKSLNALGIIDTSSTTSNGTVKVENLSLDAIRSLVDEGMQTNVNNYKVRRYLIGSDDVPVDVKEEILNINDLTISNKLINYFVSENNTDVNKEVIGSVEKNIINGSNNFPLVNSLFMQQLSNSEFNVFPDYINTKISGSDYISKGTSTKYSFSQSMLKGYMSFDNTYFTSSDMSNIYNLGNSIYYKNNISGGYKVTNSVNRAQVLFNMRKDFDILIDQEYNNISKVFLNDENNDLKDTN